MRTNSISYYTTLSSLMEWFKHEMFSSYQYHIISKVWILLVVFPVVFLLTAPSWSICRRLLCLCVGGFIYNVCSYDIYISPIL